MSKQEAVAADSSATAVTISFAHSEHGVKSNALVNTDQSFAQFVQQLATPPRVGDKDGSYFVRGPLKEGATTRADANIEAAHLVILDCDSRFDPSTGAIAEGAPPPDDVHAALVDLDITHALFTTHSHDQPGKGNRYRVVIPAVCSDSAELEGRLAWIFRELVERDVHLMNVKENATWSQPWYYPRRASAEQDYVFREHTGIQQPGIDAPAVKEEDAPVPLDTVDAEVTRAAPRDVDSVYARYNAEHGSPEAMLAVLQSKGYRLASVDERGETPTYRLLCPKSTTGNAGVVLFQCSDGVWRVYSHHGSDPLNESDGTSRAKDAFDVFRILEHGGENDDAVADYQVQLDPRPEIKIRAGQLHNTVAQVVKELATLDPPPLYQRGMELGRVAHSDRITTDEGFQLPAGTAHVLPLKAANLTVILSERFRWLRYTKKRGWQPADPASNAVAALLDGFGTWGDIPPLRALSECPILRADGRLHAEPGYDKATQLYVEGSINAIELPERVSREDAVAAMETLLEPFDEFPFVDKELDRAVLLAYLLTLAVRPLLPTAPLFGVSATTPGTGKGLLVEVANCIVRGRDAALMPPVQGRESEDEMRKRITSLVAQGLTSLNLDNCSRAIGGDSLNALLTTTEWTDRQLGSNTMIRMPVCCTLAATGNNLTVRGDMTRRSLLIQLDAGVESPESRSFAVKDLPGHVLKQRTTLLRALFTILKGFQQSGCQDYDDDRLGRFEAWSETVCHPIQWLGLPNPVLSQERLRESDPETENLRQLLAAWHQCHGDSWQTAGELVATPGGRHPADSGSAQEIDLHEALVEVAGKHRGIESRLLGWYLTRNLGRVAGGYRLEREGRDGRTGKHAHRYRVVEVTDATRGVPDEDSGT